MKNIDFSKEYECGLKPSWGLSISLILINPAPAQPPTYKPTHPSNHPSTKTSSVMNRTSSKQVGK